MEEVNERMEKVFPNFSPVLIEGGRVEVEHAHNLLHEENQNLN